MHEPMVTRRGATLVHPLAIAAVLVLLLNDHVLKGTFPGLVTGKLSDIAGLVFFPLLLAESAAMLLRRDPRGLVPGAAAVTALAFALVKVTAAGAAVFAWGLGSTQWLVILALTGRAAFQRIEIVMDPTDLLALPAVLVAVAIARQPAPLPAPGQAAGRVVSRLAHSRIASVAMAVVMAGATMATTSMSPPTGVVLSEQMKLADKEIAVRHVVWSVTKPPTELETIRLELSIRTGGDVSPSSPPAAITISSGPDRDDVGSIRIVPDNPQLATSVTRDGSDSQFTTVTLDLAASCRQGCSGGARIYVTGLSGMIVMRLTSGRPTDDSLLSLVGDGASDYTGQIGVADSGPQQVEIDLDHVRLTWTGGYVLHLSAAALQAPYANLRILLRTRISGIDDKAGMSADATLGIGASSTPIEAGGFARWHVIDLSDRCTVGLACDIPIRLDVRAGPGSPVFVPGQSPGPSPTLGHGVDIYGWSVRVEVQAFDGRQLPADGAWITPQS